MLLGIDIGTSSIKGMLMEEDGKIVSVKSSGYPVEIPRAGWAQQDPALWWEGLCDVLAQMRQRPGDWIFRADARADGGGPGGKSCVPGHHLDGSESHRGAWGNP